MDLCGTFGGGVRGRGGRNGFFGKKKQKNGLPKKKQFVGGVQRESYRGETGKESILKEMPI